MPNKNALSWFEIGVADVPRARRFYETILARPMTPYAMDGAEAAMFEFDLQSGVGGGITRMEEQPPGAGGTVIYLDVDGELDAVIARIPGAGGTVLRPKFSIGQHGFIALFRDPDGNVVGLHSLS